MKKTYTVIRLTLLAAICLLAACADAERMEDHLSQTEETMKTDPAKALDMLDSISRQNIPTREQQARYALLYTQARYLNGYEIRSDSLINTAVSYFREHGPKQSLMKSLQAKARINLVNHDLGKAVLAATEASDWPPRTATTCGWPEARKCLPTCSAGHRSMTTACYTAAMPQSTTRRRAEK